MHSAPIAQSLAPRRRQPHTPALLFELQSNWKSKYDLPYHLLTDAEGQVRGAPAARYRLKLELHATCCAWAHSLAAVLLLLLVFIAALYAATLAAQVLKAFGALKAAKSILRR